MAPTRSSNGRNRLSKPSLSSPATKAAVTTPASTSTGKKKMTKQEKVEAKARARLAMTGQYYKSPVKTSKQSAHKKPKSEDPTPKPSNDNDSNMMPSPGSESVKTIPPKQHTTTKEEGVAKQQSKETKSVVNDASRFRGVSLDDALIPEYEPELKPVPKLLLGMLKSKDREDEIIQLIMELLKQLKTITSTAPIQGVGSGHSVVAHKMCREAKMCSEAASCTLLAVARKWKASAPVQANCFACLHYLAEHATNAKDAIVSFGGVDTIVNAMRRFMKSSHSVLFHGCTCLCHLLGDGWYHPRNSFTVIEAKLQPIWCRFLQEMDGIYLLLEVMAQCKHDTWIQVQCITMLGSVATYPEARRESRRALDKACVAVASASDMHHAELCIMDARKRFMKIMFEK
jgi:hypothetical protein